MATATLRKKTRHEYIDDNKHWKAFADSLNKRGGSIRWLWQAKSGPQLKHPNVHGIAFDGESVRPDVGVAIVVDYCVGRQIDDDFGYALYFEKGNSWDDDIEAICKPR